MTQPRVLLVAESANPEWVSVPLVGWSHSRAIAERANAHLVTQIRNRSAFERAGLSEGEFTAIDTERIAIPVRRIAEALRGGRGKGWTVTTAVTSITNWAFERKVWKQFGRRIADGEFDVVHRITPLSPTVPSLLARRCRRAGVPFVLGPLNGGVPWPAGFGGARRAEREWLSYVRSAYKLLPGYRSTRENAAAILIGSRDTWQQMPRRYHHKCVYIPENAIDPSRFAMQRTREAECPLRVIFLGRLVPYKGADMLLEAAAELVKSGRVMLTIVGDGPERTRLTEMTRTLGIEAGVTMTGNIAHGQVQQHLAESDVLAFPSIREFGGAVALEAMAVGLTPIVMNYGGTGELVTDRTGYLIDIGPRATIIASLRDILSSLAVDPQPLQHKGAAARQRALELFTWSAKASQTLQVYDWVMGVRDDKPDFGMPFPDVHARAAIAHSPSGC